MRRWRVKPQRLLDDDSPLVRGAAVWALSQLIGRKKFSEFASEAIGAEVDEACVRNGASPSQHSVVMLRESGHQYSAAVEKCVDGTTYWIARLRGR